MKEEYNFSLCQDIPRFYKYNCYLTFYMTSSHVCLLHIIIPVTFYNFYPYLYMYSKCIYNLSLYSIPVAVFPVLAEFNNVPPSPTLAQQYKGAVMQCKPPAGSPGMCLCVMLQTRDLGVSKSGANGTNAELFHIRFQYIFDHEPNCTEI